MEAFQAVIFDCDGVLVDSEVLFHAVELDVLAEFGLVYESVSFKARFLGMSDKAYYAALEEEALQKLGRSIIDELRPRMPEKGAGKIRDGVAGGHRRAGGRQCRAPAQGGRQLQQHEGAGSTS